MVPSSRIAARFEVTVVEGTKRLMRLVTVNDDQAPPELLTPEESERLLCQFRSFDWGAQPAATAQSGCTLGPGPRISFRARRSGTYRELEGYGRSINALADLFEAIVSPGEDRGRLENHPAP
jgi:hypothetical protein